MASLHAGELLARRYRLIDRIGAGGMSVIWRARDEVLDRVVAIKVLAASLAADARFRSMVREEARSAAQLIHPHVTAVHDYGEAVGTDGTVTAFVVMELLAGEELDARLTAGPLPWPEAVEVCAQVAEALAAAHRLGIVHRDVTPANIMMTAVGAKVLDFGIATHVGAPDEDEEGETFGTPAYVAPERLDGTPAQPATDTYSLGVLLYETLTGRVPYPADTWEDLTRALDHDIPPLAVPGLPAQVAEICLRCLARDPLDRPTAHQVAVTLRDQLLPADPQAATMLSPTITLPTVRADRPAAVPAGRPAGVVMATERAPAASAPAVAGPPPPTAEPAAVPRAEPPHVGRPRWLSPTTAVLGTLGVLGAAVVVAVLLVQSGDDHPAPLAGPSYSSAPVAPTGPPATPPPTPSAQPTVGPTTAAPTTAAPTTVTTPATVPTVTEAISQLGQVIDEGLAEGAIRRDAGLDLQNLVRNLRVALTSGSVDIDSEVDHVRQKVAVRANEGAITYAYAAELDSALDQLAGAAT
ncbi:serine/threonine-protein kinase [Solwaraspora sp. WMMD406]|uniref:serine/threonine-protein kinase n=1 Tax=Solwaraspora sp. WMMD406 TaxID=3016095 RepID=UPI0024161360|nr:serine/threonine-protein kinase [Solwaraspora sp. WMMD406]MDG4767595.1 serine/threonine-protein kinase [Solwaraspora sp. WMMD406]